MILTIPAISKIRDRFPSAHITLISDHYSGPALRGLPYFDEIVIAHPTLTSNADYFRTMRRLSKQKFDLLIDLHGTGRSLVQTVLVGGRYRLGFDRPGGRGWLFNLKGPLKRDRHRVLSFLQYLSVLDISDDENLLLSLPVTNDDRVSAQQLLDSQGLSEPFVVVHPTFSKRPEHEIWPDTYFASVLKEFRSRGFQVAMTSGKDGKEKIDSIAKLAGVSIVNLAGKTPPLVLASILDRAELYFGYDTGPMHVAAAMNTPIVTFFEEPSKYPEWHPWTKAKFEVILPELVLREGESQAQYRADSITPEMMMAAVDRVLNLSPKPSCVKP